MPPRGLVLFLARYEKVVYTQPRMTDASNQLIPTTNPQNKVNMQSFLNLTTDELANFAIQNQLQSLQKKKSDLLNKLEELKKQRAQERDNRKRKIALFSKTPEFKNLIAELITNSVQVFVDNAELDTYNPEKAKIEFDWAEIEEALDLDISSVVFAEEKEVEESAEKVDDIDTKSDEIRKVDRQIAYVESNDFLRVINARITKIKLTGKVGDLQEYHNQLLDENLIESFQ